MASLVNQLAAGLPDPYQRMAGAGPRGRWADWDVPEWVRQHQTGYDRDFQAYRMRQVGFVYREIGRKLGGVTRARAYQMVCKAERISRDPHHLSPIEIWLRGERVKAVAALRKRMARLVLLKRI